MSGIEYEKAKNQYFEERSKRQQEFGDSLEGKRAELTGTFHADFAQLEKPFVKTFKKQQKEVRGIKKEIVAVKKNIEDIKSEPPKEEGLTAAHDAVKKKLADLAAKMAESKKRVEELKAARITGPRGGRYYTSASGEKVYVQDNPGTEVVGYMGATPFSGGLPAYVSEAEPCRGAFAPNPKSTPLPKKG